MTDGIGTGIRKVGVVGAGAMGSGIAVEMAAHGREVTVFARSERSAERARGRIEGDLARMVEVGLLSPTERREACARVRMTVEMREAVAGQDYVAESVPEDLAVKRELFAQMDAIADAEVVLASNTTALPVTAIAEDCKHPERVLSAHYYLPAHLIPLVDVIPGERTAPEAVETVRRLMVELGKQPVVLPGVVGPRLQTALVGEAFRLLGEGMADPETIDRIITLGFGRRLTYSGVFDRLDLAGLDTVVAVLQQQGKPVPPVLADKVASGHFGRKSGRGFYPWAAADDERFETVQARQLGAQLLRDRTTGAAADARRVYIADGLLDPFLVAARSAYEEATPAEPPGCFAILLGTVDETAIRVTGLRFGENARNQDPAAVDEFAEAIVPCFGAAYANRSRGFWCDSRSLLRISREAEAAGVDMVGSIHLHPDWHRIGPPTDRGLRISERPTPMDTYLFRNTGWPLNMICYLEEDGGVVHRTISAWAPPATPEAGCAQLPIGVAG